MSTELLVTQMLQASDDAPWRPTTETVTSEIAPACTDTLNKRVVVEAVTYNEAAPRSFTVWLRDQVEREDPIGDLARDYIDDCRARNVIMTTEQLMHRVGMVGCAEAREALREALDEFEKIKGRSMSDLVSRLARATFPGPIVTRLNDEIGVQVSVSIGFRNAAGETVCIEETGLLNKQGDAVQCLDPLPGEVITIEAFNLSDYV